MRWLKLASIGVISPLAIFFSGCSNSGRTTVVEAWDERPRFFTAEADEEHSTFAKVVWYERPRFFTRAEDEDQSRFEQIWDTRPRIFTSRTESSPSYAGTYPSTTYSHDSGATYSYDSGTVHRDSDSTNRTIPVESRIRYDDGTYQNGTPNYDTRYAGTHKVRTQTVIDHDPNGQSRSMISPTSDPQSYNTPPASVTQDRFTDSMGVQTPYARQRENPSYGSATHRNLTDRNYSVTHRETVAPTSPARVQLTSDTNNRIFEGRISNWPQESRVAAQNMEKKYGPPDSTTHDRLTWRDRDPFAEIVVFKDGTSHNHPDQHRDVMAHSIYYSVDASRLDDLSDFHGNIKADHNRGLLTAKCKDEAMNILALNLVHNILSGKMSVSKANNQLSEKTRTKDLDDDYMKELQFDIGEDITGENRPNPLNVDVDVDSETDVDTDAEYGVDEP